MGTGGQGEGQGERQGEGGVKGRRVKDGAGELDEMLVDRIAVELMVLEIKSVFWKFNALNEGNVCYDYDQHPNIYNTLTINKFNEGFLTHCTLEKPFNYKILDLVKKITGENSELRTLSIEAADQFFNFWTYYIELEKLKL